MSTARMTWWSPLGTKTPAAMAAEESSTGSGAEARLLRDLAEGSREAFREVYRRYGQMVFRIALQHAASRETAEEVAQETFLLLLREPGKFDPSRGELGAFLAGVARQLARRANSRAASSPREEFDESAVVDQRQAATVLGEIIEREEWQRLHTAVASLPEPYRETLVLHHLEGLPYEAVAQTLGCPVGTIRSRLARAREMLVRKLTNGKASAAGAAAASRQDKAKGGTDDGSME